MLTCYADAKAIRRLCFIPAAALAALATPSRREFLFSSKVIVKSSVNIHAGKVLVKFFVLFRCGLTGNPCFTAVPPMRRLRLLNSHNLLQTARCPLSPHRSLFRMRSTQPGACCPLPGFDIFHHPVRAVIIFKCDFHAAGRRLLFEEYQLLYLLRNLCT